MGGLDVVKRESYEGFRDGEVPMILINLLS